MIVTGRTRWRVDSLCRDVNGWTATIRSVRPVEEGRRRPWRRRGARRYAWVDTPHGPYAEQPRITLTIPAHQAEGGRRLVVGEVVTLTLEPIGEMATRR